MDQDSVLKEVRAAREAYARAHGYDVRAMVEDLRKRDECGDWPVVKLVPRLSSVAGKRQPESTPPLQETGSHSV
jgi:hypothetical protein